MLKRKVPTVVAVIVGVAMVATIVVQAGSLVRGFGQYQELQTSKAALTRLALERTASRNR